MRIAAGILSILGLGFLSIAAGLFFGRGHLVLTGEHVDAIVVDSQMVDALSTPIVRYSCAGREIIAKNWLSGTHYPDAWSHVMVYCDTDNPEKFVLDMPIDAYFWAIFFSCGVGSIAIAGVIFWHTKKPRTPW